MNTVDPQNILKHLRAIVGDGSTLGQSIALHEPTFAGREWEYVKDCLDTGWVSSVGKYVDLFERKLEDYTSATKAVAVVNGTAALHISLLLIGVERDEEVLLPSFTFVASANAVSYCAAIPHFVDIEATTLGVDAEKLRVYLKAHAELKSGRCYNRKTGRRIRALIAMHAFGHPIDIDAVTGVCEEFCIELVEDAAESLGSSYKGRHTGTFSRVAALSFNGNKVATTGGGGAILTRDERLGKLAKHLTTTAKIPHPWRFDHDQVGYNYRLPNVNAALGCAQLEQLPKFLKLKRSLAARYHEAFHGVAGLKVMKEPENSESNYWLNTLILDEDSVAARDRILEITNAAGISTRPAWTPMHQLPMFSSCPRMDLSQTESLAARIINIPSSAKLGGSYGKT